VTLATAHPQFSYLSSVLSLLSSQVFHPLLLSQFLLSQLLLGQLLLSKLVLSQVLLSQLLPRSFVAQAGLVVFMVAGLAIVTSIAAIPQCAVILALWDAAPEK